MIVFQLGKSWEVDLFNENHPQAFRNWRLRRLSVIEDLVEQSSARMTLFKPILNTPQTPDLLARFAEAKVIFVFRHYTDVINSSIKKFGLMNRIGHVNSWIQDDFLEFATYPPPETTKEAIRLAWRPELSPQDGAALYWLFYNRLYFDLNLHRDPRVLLVHYETLVAQPEEEFRQICEFLGLSFDPMMVAGIFSSSIGRDPCPNINSRIQAECERIWTSLCEAKNEKSEAQSPPPERKQLD